MHNTKVPQLLNSEGREFAENLKKSLSTFNVRFYEGYKHK